MPDVDEILNATPTVDEKESLKILYDGLARVGRGEWVVYDSGLTPEAKALAQRFVDQHSFVELGRFGPMKSPRPAVVLRIVLKRMNDTTAVGALYNNGLVLVGKEPRFHVLMIDAETASEHGYPVVKEPDESANEA